MFVIWKNYTEVPKRIDKLHLLYRNRKQNLKHSGFDDLQICGKIHVFLVFVAYIFFYFYIIINILETKNITSIILYLPFWPT